MKNDGSEEKSIPVDAPLVLKTEEQAREYLRLFCAFVWAENGSFSIITDKKDLPKGTDADPDLLNIHCSNEEKDKDGETFREMKAYVRYSAFAFVATFRLWLKGKVEMTGDHPVRQYEGVEAEILSQFMSPYRLLPIKVTSAKDFMQRYRSDFKGWTSLSDHESEIKQFKKEAIWWATLLKGLAGMTVLLNGASCKMLEDNAALAWMRALKVELESFDYHQVYIPQGFGPQVEIGARLDWVRGRLKKPEPWWKAGGYFLLTLVFFPISLVVVIWLWATWKRTPSVFRAQPYAHLAKVMRERGDDDAAREVEAEKLWQGAVDSAVDTRGGRAWKIYWWRPYGVMFRYGLSPLRAGVSVLVIWLLGWFCVSMLSRNEMLQANVIKVAPAALVENGEPVMVVPAGTPGVPPSFRCGDAIEPGLYAFELLTPILNLRQENRCEIRSKPAGENSLKVLNKEWPVPAIFTHAVVWEYGEALYMLAGTIITSLAILTFSGIARRWEH